VPGGQPFGVDPVGVAVAAQHRQRYARPWWRSACPRADPQLPHRMVPALPAVRAVRLHDYADIGISRTYGTRSPRCSLSAGVHSHGSVKWLSHNTFTLTLETYGDWIPKADGEWLIRCPNQPPRRSLSRRLFCRSAVSRASAFIECWIRGPGFQYVERLEQSIPCLRAYCGSTRRTLQRTWVC
jgi:hypothetical protein